MARNKDVVITLGGGVKIGFIDAGFKEIMKSPELEKLVYDTGDKLANTASGKGARFRSKNTRRVVSGADRPTALIHPANKRTYTLEAEGKLLEKAVARCAKK